MPVLPPDMGTGFTSVGEYLDANQGTLAREGSDISSDVGGQIDAAHKAAEALPASGSEVPGYKDALDKAIAAKDQATALGSQGGLSDYFQKHFHDTHSQGDFDASLLGGSGKLDVTGLQGRANDLEGFLNGPHGTPAATPAAPAAAEPEDVDRNTGAGADQAGRLPRGNPPGYQAPVYPPPARRPRNSQPQQEL